MDESSYKKGFLGDIEKRITDEMDHVMPATRRHIMKIVDEVARTYLPVGNIPCAPIHDDDYFCCDLQPKLDSETLSRLISHDKTFGWNGDC